MKPQVSDHKPYFKLPALITGVLLLFYLAVRAWKIPIINDEAITFFLFVLYGKFIPYFSEWDANNHILNSFLVWLSTSVFGDHIFFMRLPSLFTAALYFYFTWKLSLLFDDKRIMFLFLCGMWLAHGVIEFMALARGYGMSLGLLTGAIWYFCRLWHSEKTRHVLLSALFMLLATLANLTLLITMLLVFTGIIATMIFQKKKYWITILSGSLMAIIAILFILYSFELRARDLLFWGSRDGFYDVTIRSLSVLLTGSDNLSSVLLTIAGGITLVIAGIAILKIIKYRVINSPLIIFPLLFLLNLVAIFSMTLLLEVNYPHDRTGLHLIFLLIGSLCFAAQFIGKYGWFLALPLILFPIHALFNINVNHVTNWPKDLIADEIPDHLIALNTDTYQPTIGGTDRRELCWNYLSYRRGGRLNSLMIYDYPSKIPDYQLCLPSEKEFFKENYSELLNVRSYGNLLMKRNSLLKNEYFIDEPIQPSGPFDHEFIGLKDIYLEGNTSTALAIECDLDYSVTDEWLPSFLIITVFDKDHNPLFYDRVFLHWLERRKPDKVHKARVKIIAPLDPGSHMVKFYFWNRPYQLAPPEKPVTDVTISGGHLKAAWLE